jgi:enamine deaminase RidA (YjgF/YER057c/UK114 family)
MQAGFVQVEAKKGRRVYVAKTKRVGRVDLSGFSVTDAEFGTMAHSAGKFGAVEQELDFRKQEGESDQTAEERILNNFTKILEHMKTLGERVSEKKSGTKAEGTKGEKPKGWSGAGKSKSAKTEAAGTTTGEVNGAPKNDLLESIKEKVAKINRSAMIVETSRDKNVPVSKKVRETIENLTAEIDASLQNAGLEREQYFKDNGIELKPVSFEELAAAGG